jgi:hypothetical protein
MTKINLPASPAVSKYQRPAFGNGRYYISTSDGKILVNALPKSKFKTNKFRLMDHLWLRH